MDGFKKMDDKFVDRALNPAVRSYLILKMERGRLLMFFILILMSALAAFGYFVRHQAPTAFWWLPIYFVAFVEIDYKIKLFKTLERLQPSAIVSVPNISADEFSKTFASERNRRIFFVLGIVMIGIVVGFFFRPIGR